MESSPSKATLLARLVLGGFFIRLGYLKAIGDPIAFMKIVREYDLIADEHYQLLNLIVATLPFAEIVLGVLLILGIARRGTAFIMLAMLVPFTLSIYARATGMAADSGQALCAIEFDCGCGTGPVQVCKKLAENSLLIVLSAWLTFARSSALSIRDSLLRNG